MAVLVAASSVPVPQLVFLLFAGAIWLIRILNSSKAAAPAPPRRESPAGGADAGGDAGVPSLETEEEQRVRRVREEILRKIAERNPSASARELRNIVKAAYERKEPLRATAPAALPPPQQGGAAAPAAIPAAAYQAGQSAVAVPRRTIGSAWLDELRSPESVRKAILAREILGPPISLR